MLQNSEGLPAEPKDLPADYPIRITWSGILVDDEGHPEDIIARVREAIEVIWKDKAEDIEQEAIEILGVNSLREYLCKPTKFFADHLKRYSKSRRPAIMIGRIRPFPYGRNGWSRPPKRTEASPLPTTWKKTLGKKLR